MTLGQATKCTVSFSVTLVPTLNHYACITFHVNVVVFIILISVITACLS